MGETDFAKNRDSAIFCIAVLCKMSGLHLSYEQIYHNFFKGNRKYHLNDLCKGIKEMKLDAKIISNKLEKIKASGFPVIAETSENEFFLILKRDQQDANKYLIHNYGDNRAAYIDTGENTKPIQNFISVTPSEKQKEKIAILAFHGFSRLR